MHEIYLIRHGESAANAGLATASNAAIPLTDRGRKQAESLAQNFREICLVPTEIIVSPYRRTFATAVPMLRGDNPPPVVIRGDLREFSYLTPQSNSTWDERAIARDAFWSRAGADFGFHETSAESLVDFYSRAERSLDFLTNSATHSRDAQVFAFSHEMMIAAILSLTRAVPREKFLRELAVARKVEPPIKHTQVAKLILANSAMKIVSDNLFGV